MPAIFLVVAALVLGVLVSRLVEHQRTEIGTLKALGYSDRAVQRHVLKFGLAIGLIGGLAGLVLGYRLAGGMTTLYEQFFEFPDLRNQIDPRIYVFAPGDQPVVRDRGVSAGARVVQRLAPAEAMRPKPPRQGGAIALERVGWLWGRLSMSWRLVLRNVVRTRRRSLIGRRLHVGRHEPARRRVPVQPGGLRHAGISVPHDPEE